LSKNKRKGGKNSDVVSKESLSAVGALFSLCAFFVLCTGSLVFGDIGSAIQSFLLGVFGYAAYPLFAAGLYLGTTALFGWKFVKHRKTVMAFWFALLFLGLLLHIACTYSWNADGYLTKCFKSGENFPSCTATGWLGGLLVAALVALTTKIGTIVIFSVLFVLCTYLFIVAVRKNRAKKGTEKGTEKPKKTKPVEETDSPITIEGQAATEVANTYAPANGYPQPNNAYAQQQNGYSQQPNGYPQPPTASGYGYGYGTAGVHQTPGVRLNDNGEVMAGEQGYSPFAPPPFAQGAPEYEGQSSRDFLFNISPQESYQKNLIFDAGANVNKRPVETPLPKTDSAYTPSYLNSYENSIGDGQPVRTSEPYANYPQTPTPAEPTPPTPSVYGNPYSAPAEPIPPAPTPSFEEELPIKPSYLSDERESVQTPFSEPFSEASQRDGSFGRTVNFEEERSGFAPMEERGDSAPIADERGNARNEYSDYFSLSNPDIFGREEEDTRLTREREEPFLARGEEFSDREEACESSRLDEDREIDAFDIFEEREEDTVLDERTRLSDEREEEAETGRFGFGRETREPLSERGFERTERTEWVEPPKAEEPKPTPPPPPPKPRVIKPYVRVPIDYFDCRDVMPDTNQFEVERTKEEIVNTLASFKINEATVSSVTFGPTVTRYNVVVPRHISSKKVVALDQDIALNLQAAAGVNMYPNFEDGAVSIEVPNRKRQFVQLGCMLTGDAYVNAKPSSLTFAMGKDVGNRKVYGDICKMIHLLVAGSSGSGKSVFLGSLIISLIAKYSPAELRLILIDPKKTEFVLYNNLPHLMINEIITDVHKAIQSLNWAIGEMNRRYTLFEQMSRAGTYVVNIDEYNSHLPEGEEKLPKIVIIIDELADLMLAAKKDVEDRIQNLTQKARAAGIHLIVATQRPSADVITGVIKGNLPTRIAFAVAAEVDSRVILDQTGAQKLLGKGDFLYTMSGINTPVRVQSAFISSEESQNVINFIKMNNEAYFDETATAFINNTRSGGDASLDAGEEGVEGVYVEALRYVILSGSASISMIQRKCSVGYNKAGKIIEWMEEMGYISTFDGAKARKVLITKEEFESKFGAL